MSEKKSIFDALSIKPDSCSDFVRTSISSKSIFNSINSEEEIYLTECWSELLHPLNNSNKIIVIVVI